MESFLIFVVIFVVTILASIWATRDCSRRDVIVLSPLPVSSPAKQGSSTFAKMLAKIPALQQVAMPAAKTNRPKIRSSHWAQIEARRAEKKAHRQAVSYNRWLQKAA